MGPPDRPAASPPSPGRTRCGWRTAGPAGRAGLRHPLGVHRVRGRAGAVRADLAPVLAAPRPSRSTRTSPWTTPRPGGPSGSAAERLRRWLAGRGAPLADHAQGADLRTRPAGSWPRRRRRCRSRSAARATGTTATAGCATPRSPCRRWLGAGYLDEAGRWRDWLLRAVAGDPADLQIMYGLDRQRRIPELELPWLSGYEGSAPVRIGNAAAEQLQLDVWGEVLDGLALAREAGLSSNDDAWELQITCWSSWRVTGRTRTTGCGRCAAPRRHFVHSKVMAWVAFDRMIAGVEHFRLDGPVDRWRAIRDADPRRGADQGLRHRAQHLHPVLRVARAGRGAAADPAVGFLPWDDPRVAGTVDAVEPASCATDGLVLRYRPGSGASDDGLPGGEGAFLACSFWLADALHGIGRHDEATGLFERLLALSQRRRPAGRGVRPERRTAGRQHPAGVQPPGPDQRRPAPVRGPVGGAAAADAQGRSRPESQGGHALGSIPP